MDKPQAKSNMSTQDADFHPVYAVSAQYNNNEISLVDLAKILIRRRLTLFVTAFGVIALALIFTQTRSEKFEYASIYQAAEQELNEPLVASATLTSLINDSFLPDIQREYPDTPLPKVAISVPQGTLLLMLKSISTAENRDLLRDIHQKVFQNVQSYELNQLERTRETLNRQLSNVQELINQVSKADEVQAELMAGYLSHKHNLQEQLSALAAPKILSLVNNNGQVIKFSNNLILALSVILGSIMGIIAAFMQEFACRVKEALQEDKA